MTTAVSIKTILRTAAAVLALAALLVAGAARAADSPPPGPDAGPPSTQDDGRPAPGFHCKDQARGVRGLGRHACRLDDGLWKVKLANGNFLVTHGIDPAHDVGGQTGVFSPDALPRQPVCATSNEFHAIIAVPSDMAGNETAAAFRALIKQADGVLYQGAVESGSPSGADFRFLCDTSGQIQVDVVRLQISSADADFGFDTIANELENLGYKKSTEKYVVYVDASLGDACGVGSLNTDELASASNLNNKGAFVASDGTLDVDFAMDFDSDENWDCEADTLLHEMGHNLGAVQNGAPYATGVNPTDGNGHHCYEGKDVMCYNDGGSTDPGFIDWNCLDFDHFDCNHDTYFDAKIGAGQGAGPTGYLASHWNIGGCYDSWIVNNSCDTTLPVVGSVGQLMPSTLTTAGTAIDASGQVTVKASWTGSDAGGSGLAGYTAFVSINGTWKQVATSGTATSASVSLLPGTNTYQFAIQAVDGAGNKSNWAYGSAFKLTAYQEDSTSIVYSGSWSRYYWQPAWGGYEKSSATNGNTATLKFTGRNVAWVAPTGSNRGQASVYIDGTLIKTIDLLSSTAQARLVDFSYYWTSSGSHSIQVKVVGTASRPAIDIDGFVVMS